MQREDGKTRLLPHMPHDVVYIPSRWAHRVINIGKDKMSFMYACRARAPLMLAVTINQLRKECSRKYLLKVKFNFH